MNATAKHHEPSDADVAAALEQFEIDRLKEELRQQRIAHTEELSAVRHQAEQEPLDRMIERWNGYPVAIERAEKAEADLAKARAEHASVTETMNIVADNAAKFEQLADHYKDQCEKMLAKNNTNVEKANETIERLQRQVRELNIQIRTYREMNPDKLKKQVKRLQDKNKDLTGKNEALTKKFDQASKDKAQLAKDLEATRKMNRNLTDALDDACKLADQNGEPHYTWKDDEWGVLGHEHNTTEQIFIVHLATGERRVFNREKGVQRASSIPQYVKDMAQQKLDYYATVDQRITELSA